MPNTTRLIPLLCLLAATLTGCFNPSRIPPKEESGYAALSERLRQEQEHLIRAREERPGLLEQIADPAPTDLDLAPMLPEFNPLQETVVSISIHDRPLHDVLYVLARDAGLNLVISPGISLDDRVTISFDRTQAGLIVNRLLDAYDLAWEVEDNILAVRPFQEEIFRLDFLNANAQLTIDSGGDIFGSSGAGSDTHSLRGNFSIQSRFGQGSDGNTTYGFLRTNLQEILAGSGQETAGHYVLDPTASTLYVRTSPQKMRVVRQFIQTLQKKMAAQVVIDAQILEVQLSDSFQLGVDWNYVIASMAGNTPINTILDWQTTFQPIVVNPAQFTSTVTANRFQATIEALETFGSVHVVSNPHVRARHMQPALVTSGTTSTYVREISRTEATGTPPIITYTVETDAAFEGVMLGVLPFITEENAVDLNVFPITSQVDLATKAQIGDNEITLPVVDIRNVSTNVRVRDGDMVILGGLIQKGKADTDRGIPGISKAPLVGWLFNHRHDVRELTELVVVMHVRVLAP